MAQVTDPHLLLDAIQFATDADLAALRHLAAKRPDTLKPELFLRIILTFLPETTDPATYVGLVRDITRGNLNALDEDAEPPQPSKHLSEDQARRALKRLHLLPLSCMDGAPEGTDILTRFLFSRARRIDTETGSLLLLRQLLDPFLDHSSVLKTWILTIVRPLLRLEYEAASDQQLPFDLASFEALSGLAGLDELLEWVLKISQESASNAGWCMQAVIGPWIYGQVLKARPAGATGKEGAEDIKSSEREASRLWGRYNEWLFDLARHELSKALGIFEGWGGPEDVVDIEGILGREAFRAMLSRATMAYAQTCLASIYVAKASSPPVWDSIRRLIERTATLGDLPQIPDSGSLDMLNGSFPLSLEYVSTISKIHALATELLEESNPLTRPSAEALKLALYLLVSLQTLDSLGHKGSLSSMLSLGPLGSEMDQRSVLVRVLHNIATGSNLSDDQWASTRRNMHWLRTWSSPSPTGASFSPATFGRLGSEELESGLLRALLSSNRLALASAWFCQGNTRPLPPKRVEQIVVEAGLKAFDSASNGNRTRGGMKKASELVQVFQPHFPSSRGIQRLTALVHAVHSLSFYSLTLQHGVPLLPANVRAHQTPLSLIEKVLEQNAKSYTHLDDLLQIGRSLIHAGLIKAKDIGAEEAVQSDATLRRVEKAIIASTIRAALAQHDFDTAYAYIINRLSRPDESNVSSDPADDVLWKAAFEAGRYPPEATSSPSNLRRLEQKMELLSQALLLAPASEIPAVLQVWRDAEKQVDLASVRETKQDEAWRKRGDQRPPGAFIHDEPAREPEARRSRGAAADEAPVGLFDVARGAAAALHKSAFPLHGQRNTTLSQRSGDEEGSEASTEAARTRKRDVVSNMVTGGLASGIGWVLGEYMDPCVGMTETSQALNR